MFPPFPFSNTCLRRPLSGLHLLVLSSASVVFASASLSAQTLVYTAPTTGSSVALPFDGSNPEAASGVHLAGPDREIVTAEIPFFSILPAAASLTFSIYAAVPGSNASPSALFSQLQPDTTPLYTTGPLNMSLTGSGPVHNLTQTLVFSNINTLVPENFFWSITINSRTFDTSSTGGYVPPPNDGEGGRIGPVYAPFLSGGSSPVTVTGTDTSLGFAFVRNPPGDSAYPEQPWTTVPLATHGPVNGIPSPDFGRDRTLAASFTAVPEGSVSCLAAGAIALLAARRRR